MMFPQARSQQAAKSLTVNRHRWGVCALPVAAVVTVGALGVVAVPPAGADVFHGYWIMGRIEETFHRLGGLATFGNPTTSESDAARGGKFQVFTNNASIYWHPDVSSGVARQVGGRIRDKWSDIGWEHSALGYPTTDESTSGDGVGKFNHFEGGSIYWSPSTDAHQVWGLILDKWNELDAEVGELGYPVTDEGTTPDGVGRFNHFEHGSIYYHPTYGTYQVSGPIRALWEEADWEKGRFGYPVSDPYLVDGGVRQDFAGGAIQTVEPTGVALPKYDNAAYSSYRQVRPLLTVDDYPSLSTQGLTRELISHMGDYFPLSGCPNVLTTGAVCTLAGVGGVMGSVIVDRIGDDGFTLKTQDGHPEGSGRLLTIRFDEVAAPAAETDPDASAGLVFDTLQIEQEYSRSDATWLRLIVEASGPVADSEMAGPFVSEHVGMQVFGELSSRLRERAPESTTTYIPTSV